MKNIREKRIMNEIKKINTYNETNTNNIYIDFNENNIDKFQILICGPLDTIFYNGFFIFDVELPLNYPTSPPNFTFITPKYANIGRIHPNLYQNGKVCLDVLNTWANNNWSPSSNLISIAVTIQSILDNDPLSHEPGNHKNNLDYKLASEYKTLISIISIYNNRHLFYKNITNKIEEIYNNNQDYINSQKEKFNEMIGKYIKYFHGQLTITKFWE